MPIKRINAAKLKKLEKYAWPGNIREFQHAIERTVILTDDKILQPAHFVLTARETRDEGIIFDNYNLEEAEKIIIRKVLNKYHGNITKAADELGLTRTSLYRRLEKYAI